MAGRLSGAGPVVVECAEGSIQVRAFPDDEHFVRDLRRAVDSLASEPRSEARVRVELAGILRAWYPRFELRPREGLAGLVETERVWYAFRDGKAGSPSPRTDRLHAALSDARETAGAADHALERARATLARTLNPGGRPDGRRGSGSDE